MRITVLVTAYNLEAYLARCLDSILEQTALPDEVIIVDDASLDGTSSIARDYCRQHQGWRYLRPEHNLGVLRATLFGMKQAHGEVICFLDGDDVWRPEKVAGVRSRFERDARLVLLSHAYVKVNELGQVLQSKFADVRYMTQLVSRQPERVDDAMRRAVLTYSGLVWLGSAWSVRLSSLDLDRFQAFVDKLPDARLTYQDHVLAVYLLLNSEGSCGWIPEPLLEYRLHGANTSGDTRNLERARLTARKGLLTREATLALVQGDATVPHGIRDIHLLRFHEIQFLNSLYGQDYRGALRLYGRCFWRLWHWPERLKESLRLLGCMMFGPAGFIRLKSRLFSN